MQSLRYFSSHIEYAWHSFWGTLCSVCYPCSPPFMPICCSIKKIILIRVKMSELSIVIKTLPVMWIETGAWFFKIKILKANCPFFFWKSSIYSVRLEMRADWVSCTELSENLSKSDFLLWFNSPPYIGLFPFRPLTLNSITAWLTQTQNHWLVEMAMGEMGI